MATIPHNASVQLEMKLWPLKIVIQSDDYKLVLSVSINKKHEILCFECVPVSASSQLYLKITEKG